MDLDEALTWLDDHLDLERTPAVAGRIRGLSLEPMRRIAHVLGDPQEAYPVVHLTGTNGKGSTARMISALLAAHDLSVGTYTSPHLEHVVERITWNLHPIDADDFARVVDELATLEPLMREELRGVSSKPPSYFELLTAAAYAWFAEVAVDVAVVEVGMLGAWDATNVADARVAVITNVRKDHTSGQGDWRRRIAEEKSGIIDPGSHVVLGETAPELRPIFEAPAAAGMWVRDRDFGAAGGAIALGGRVADLWAPHGRYDEVFVPLHGAHQIDNAACAVAAVEALFDRALDPGLVREALAAVHLPGRFEVLHRGPLLVLDGAHNSDGAAAVARTLADEFSVEGRRRWVLGMLVGRDIDEMLDGFGIGAPAVAGNGRAAHPDQVIACAPDVTRAVPAEELAAHVAKRGVEVEVIADVGQAVAHAWTDATAAGEGDLVMVTGSLYTIGEARTATRRLGLL